MRASSTPRSRLPTSGPEPAAAAPAATPAEHSAYRSKPEGKSLHGRIVRELGMRILAGELAPGARLPAEAELAARYDVSRPVLREAVRVLVAKGLVVSRQRAGARVRPRCDWHLLDPDVLFWMSKTRPEAEFIESLMTVRRIFEPAAAALAARTATAAQLESIAEAFAGMAAATDRDALLEPDLAFHRAIAEATGNELLAHIGNMLSLALRESIKMSSRLPDTHALSLPRHKAILAALQRRDAQAASAATLRQLDAAGRDLRRVLKSSR